MMTAFLFPTLITIVLILINGLFVTAEFSIIGVRKTRIVQMAEQGNRVAIGVLQILENPVLQDRYISTAQLGITIASLGLGMYAEEAFAQLLLGPLHEWVHLSSEVAHTVSVVIALSLLTFFHVVVGEMVPKSIALHYPEQAVHRIATPMMISRRIFSPAVWLLNTLGAGVLRLLRIPLVAGSERVHSTEELIMIIDDSFEQGQLDVQEKLMLNNVFEFGAQRAYEVMTHRTRVEAYPVDIAIDELLSRLSESRFSRFPIYRDSLDNVVGILLLKDLARQQIHEGGEFDLGSLLRRAPMIPAFAPIESVLASFKRLHLHMAIVIDEYGGMAGILTLEDLVEEVLGEVKDEFDQELPLIHRVSTNEFLIRGDYPLADLEGLVLLDTGALQVSTVGGMIVALLDRMPQVGDRVEIGDLAFIVETIRGRAVQTARMQLPRHPEN